MRGIACGPDGLECAFNGYMRRTPRSRRVYREQGDSHALFASRFNRHRHGDPRPLARTLRLYFTDVKIRRVRRTGENTLICCSRPLLSRAAGA